MGVKVLAINGSVLCARHRQWAQSRGLLQNERIRWAALMKDDEAGGPIQTARKTASTRHQFAIANPPDGATYLIDPTLRTEFQTLSLRAAADRDSGAVEWTIDGQRVGRAEPDKPFAWPLVAGPHHVVARDEQGRSAEAKIVVR